MDHPSFLAKVWGLTGSKLYGEKSGADYGEGAKPLQLGCLAVIHAAVIVRSCVGLQAWRAELCQSGV